MTNGDFEAKVAVITGGARGIGLESARMMLARGGRVALWDADQAALDTALADLAVGDRATGTTVDVADDAAVAVALDDAVRSHGKVDILVNSAGIIGAPGVVTDTDSAVWRRVLEVNLSGTFLCSKLAAPAMVGRGWGRIVNIASLAGKDGTPSMAAYSASKAGVIALTKVMGKELATSGVLVNCIAPAALDTEMARNADPALVKIMIDKSPMARLGTAEECAELVCWLASDRLGFSTGACFDLSGGRAVY
jgi:NAD(P)-dependent dehydrogenase (short-subunit alcohol dehydrogenase family)